MENSQIEALVQSYLTQLSPEQIARSNAYFEGGYWLILWNFLAALIIAGGLMGLGWSQKMRDFSERIVARKFLQAWIYAALYIFVTSLLSFPLTIYQGFYREKQYDLMNLTLGGWLKEQAIGMAVGLILGGAFIAILYKIIRRSQKNWWVLGTLASVAFFAFTVLITPVFIAPLFNKYTPLPQGDVREQILSMARSNGVPADEVYQFDASKQSDRISANVSGLGKTMRISLNDNLLNRTSLAEIRAVMAHEIGHFTLNHVFKFIMEFGLVLLFGFYFVAKSFQVFVEMFSEKYGLRGTSDLAGFPVLMALLSVYMFLMTPVTNTIVRSGETEADIYGLNLSREPDGFAKVALKLSEYRKMSPGYWEEFIFYDHPSGEARIRMAMKWKAENPKKD